MVQPGKAGVVVTVVLTLTVFGVGAEVRMFVTCGTLLTTKFKAPAAKLVIVPLVGLTLKLTVGRAALNKRSVAPVPSESSTVKFVKLTAILV